MDHHKSALERAFELAKEGSCLTISDIRRRMRSEGYDYWFKRDQKYYPATIVENGCGGRYIINHSVMPSEIDWGR